MIARPPANDPVLTRWSIVIRDYVGSDTLRGLSGDAEMLFVRMCLDQVEHGRARPKEHWKRAHGHRCRGGFDLAWVEVEPLFDVGEDGMLTHRRVTIDVAQARAEIVAKAAGAKEGMKNRVRDSLGRLTSRSAPGVLEESLKSPPGQVQVDPSSASASASVSGPEGSTHPGDSGAKDRSTSSSSAGKAKIARKAATGPAADVTRAFEAEFLRVRGVEYAFCGAKDGDAVKALLGFAHGDVAKVLERVPVFFRDQFRREKASLAMFRAKWNECVPPRASPAQTTFVDSTQEPENAAFIAQLRANAARKEAEKASKRNGHAVGGAA